MIAMSYKRMSLLALAACLAVGPVSAQVRVGAVAEGGVPGLTGAAAGSVSAPAAALAPSLTAVSLSPSLIVPVAPAVVAPVAAVQGVPAAAAGEGVRAALAALAPDNLGKISGENAKALSAQALGLDEGRAKDSEADAVAGLSAASTPDLDPPSGHDAPGARTPASPSRRAVSPGLLGRVEIKLHYAKRWIQEYYWYSFTHIIDMWPSYKTRWEKARSEGTLNIARPRAFFSHMRVAGTSGKFYVLGISPLEDEAVITNLRQAYLMWFDGRSRGPAELAAFDRFTDRALLYNSERRAPTNMRKHIRDALIKASTMKSSQIAGFFDSLLVEETARETADFQNKGAQKKILDAFHQAVLDTLAEEPKGDKNEVVAALLMGSFAGGSAGPKSDFDLEVFTRGGREKRVAGFIKRLTDRWIASGHHKNNPVGVHEHPYKPIRGVVDMVHSADYIVISHDPELVEALQRKPGEPAKFAMLRAHTSGGYFGRAVQYSVILGSTYVGDVLARFGRTPGGH